MNNNYYVINSYKYNITSFIYCCFINYYNISSHLRLFGYSCYINFWMDEFM